MSIRRLALLAASFSLLLAACAEVPQSPEARAEAEAVNDPLEPANRVIFDVNDFLDRLLIQPLTELYRFAVPDYLRARVAGIVSDMKEPVILVNNLLQGEMTRAETTTARFLVNSTVGLGGMYDVATGWGLEQQQGDFGQTLYAWGAGEGPYLVLPLFGPSNVRDAAGMGVDTFAEPWPYMARWESRGARDTLEISEFAANGLTRREESLDAYNALKAGSIDFYAEMRSIVRQYRHKQLGINDAASMPKFEDYE